jgi:hypothetical protein
VSRSPTAQSKAERKSLHLSLLDGNLKTHYSNKINMENSNSQNARSRCTCARDFNQQLVFVANAKTFGEASQLWRKAIRNGIPTHFFLNDVYYLSFAQINGNMLRL